MAISTSGVYLKYKKAGSQTQYETLVDIKAFPDMGAAPQTCADFHYGCKNKRTYGVYCKL